MATNYLPASGLAALLDRQTLETRNQQAADAQAAQARYDAFLAAPTLGYEAINSQFKNRYQPLGSIFGGSFNYDMPRYLVESSFGNINPLSPYAKGFDPLMSLDPEYRSKYFDQTPYIKQLEAALDNPASLYDQTSGTYKLPTGLIPYNGTFATINSSLAENLVDVPDQLERTLGLSPAAGANTDARALADLGNDYYAMAPEGMYTGQPRSPYNFDPSNNLVRPGGGYLVEGMQALSALNTSGRSDASGSWADQLVNGALSLIPTAISTGWNAVLPGIGGSLANMFMGASYGQNPNLLDLGKAAYGAYNLYDTGFLDRIDPGIPGAENQYGATSFPLGTQEAPQLTSSWDSGDVFSGLSSIYDIAKQSGMIAPDQVGNGITVPNVNQYGLNTSEVVTNALPSGEFRTGSYELLNEFGTPNYDKYGGIDSWVLPNVDENFGSITVRNDVGSLFDKVMSQQGGARSAMSDLYSQGLDSSITLPTNAQGTGLSLATIPSSGEQPSMLSGLGNTSSDTLLPPTSGLDYDKPTENPLENIGGITNNSTPIPNAAPTQTFEGVKPMNGDITIDTENQGWSVPTGFPQGSLGNISMPMPQPQNSGMFGDIKDWYQQNKGWVNPAAKGIGGLFSVAREQDALSKGIDALKPYTQQAQQMRSQIEADRAGIMADYNKQRGVYDEYNKLLGDTYKYGFDIRAADPGTRAAIESMSKSGYRQNAARGFRGNDTALKIELAKALAAKTGDFRKGLVDARGQASDAMYKLGGLGNQYSQSMTGIDSALANMFNQQNQMRMQREAALPRMATNWASQTFGDPLQDMAMQFAKKSLPGLFDRG